MTIGTDAASYKKMGLSQFGPLQGDTPPRPPDLTDEVLRKSRSAEALRLLAGRGRRSTFIGGEGFAQPGLGGTKSLLGGGGS